MDSSGQAPELDTVFNYVNGARHPVGSEDALAIYNPATGENTSRVICSTPRDVDVAVRAAKTAFPGWSETPPLKRARTMTAFLGLLHGNKDRLAEIITAEHGKVFSDAQGEVDRAIESVEFACGIPQLLKGDFSDQASAGIDNWTLRQPLGWSRASRRSIFPSWYRHGCFRWRSLAATVSYSSRVPPIPRPRLSLRN